MNYAAAPVALEFSTTMQYILMYNDRGSGSDKDGAFFRPQTSGDWFILGDYAQDSYNAPSQSIYLVRVTVDDPNSPALKPPLGYALVWKDKGSGGDRDGSFWVPVAPDGYVAIGSVSQDGYDTPSVPSYRCLRQDLAVQVDVGGLIWWDKGSGADSDVAVYRVNPVNTFLAVPNYDPPTTKVWVPRALL